MDASDSRAAPGQQEPAPEELVLLGDAAGIVVVVVVVVVVELTAADEVKGSAGVVVVEVHPTGAAELDELDDLEDDAELGDAPDSLFTVPPV
ncbi:MAG: hypothetical protein ABIV94_08025 [Acidimicrobiales bacterium]